MNVMTPNDVYVRKVEVLNNSISLFLISVLLLFWCFTAIAEDLPLSLAEHLFAQSNYDAAITEYKRFLFFHPDDTRVGEVYYNNRKEIAL